MLLVFCIIILNMSNGISKFAMKCHSIEQTNTESCVKMENNLWSRVESDLDIDIPSFIKNSFR